jgi:hypothetical protein
VLVQVRLGRFIRVMRRLLVVSMRENRMMRCFLIVTGFVMRRRLLVVVRSMLVVLGRMTMMLGSLLRHSCLLLMQNFGIVLASGPSACKRGANRNAARMLLTPHHL